MIPAMGCGELEGDTSSQEVTNTPKGDVVGRGELDHSLSELHQLGVGLGRLQRRVGLLCFLITVRVRDIRTPPNPSTPAGEKARLGRISLRVSRTSEKQGLPVGKGSCR
jgi:hypothetical protein